MFLGRQAVGRNNQPAKAISMVREPHFFVTLKIDSGNDARNHFPRPCAPNRHSGESRSPEGRGEGKTTAKLWVTTDVRE